MPIVSGTLLGPNVRVMTQLGSGAMGTVWLAENASLGSHVAVKVLHAARNDAKGRARFMREARAAAKLVSPHIVRVFDVGSTEDDELYLVMERLHGRDLRHVIEEDGALSLAHAVLIVTQICRGLQHAHDHGMLHRDIKPANVFVVEVDDTPFVKLLDFGIAKLSDDDLDLTGSGTLMGTPYYMSPEQLVTPSDVDRRSDLWSVAVVAYACLTGKLPFHGESVGALSLAVHSGAFDPPSHAHSGLPASLDAFFMRGFSVDREHRFQSATELQAALATHLPDPLATAHADPLAKSTTKTQPHHDREAPLVSSDADTLDESTAPRQPRKGSGGAPRAYAPETSTDAQTLDSTTDERPQPSNPPSARPRIWGIGAGVSAIALGVIGVIWAQAPHEQATNATGNSELVVRPPEAPTTIAPTPASSPTPPETEAPSASSSGPVPSSTAPSVVPPLPHVAPNMAPRPLRDPPRPEPPAERTHPSVTPSGTPPVSSTPAAERPPARENWP